MAKKDLARQDMRKYLDQLNEVISKPLTLGENFLMNGETPMDPTPSTESETFETEVSKETQNIETPEETKPLDKGSETATLLGVKDEINQIRTIALNTIARLSNYPNSEGYDMMKKIWNMCDKAIAPAKGEDNNGGGSAE